MNYFLYTIIPLLIALSTNFILEIIKPLTVRQIKKLRTFWMLKEMLIII